MPVYTLTWNELAEISPLDMDIEGPPVIESDRSTSRFDITFRVTRISESAMEELEKINEKRVRGLAAILRRMWTKAAERQGSVQRKPDLGHGLGVDLSVGIDGVIRYQIYRRGVYPSNSEWDTMLKKLPVAVIAHGIKRFDYQGKYYIQAELLIAHEEKTA